MRGLLSHPRAPLAADVTLALVLCVLLVVVARPSFHAPGSAFDEGFALAYPVRVLEGDVPHRDFSSFYGPGNPWLIAAAFAVAGRTQDTERVVGILYRLLLALAAAGLARVVAGRGAALAAGGLTIAVLVPPLGLAAYAAVGALAAAMTALAALAAGRLRGGRGWFVAGGLLAGLALLLRPDFFAALVLPAAPLLAGEGGRRRLAMFGAGLAPGLLALLVHLAIVGPDRVSRIVSDMRASGAARELPFDPGSASSLVAEPSRLLVLAGGLALAGLAAAFVARRRDPRAPGWRALAALALLVLCLVPYALSRLDIVHVGPPLVCALALVPMLVSVVRIPARARDLAALAAGAAVLVLAVKLAHTTLEAPVRTQASIVLGRTPQPPWELVRNGPRSFSVPPGGAIAPQQIIDGAERERRAGARTLIVAPADLRRAYANDTYLYFILADLQPATFYMEFNPLTVNRAGSGLVDDLRRADLLILNSVWDDFVEQNDSQVNGPDAPNEVVRRQFCERVVAGSMRLLRRCRT